MSNVPAGQQAASAVAAGPAVKSLAEYLLASGLCEENFLSQTLERQDLLRQRGYGVSLEELLVESGRFSAARLAAVVRQRDLDCLHASSFFSRLTLQEVRHIFEQGSVQEVAAGAFVYRQGEVSECAYIVLDGSVSLSHLTEDGREAEIAVLRPGEAFGEMSLLSASPHFVDAKALEATRLFRLSGLLFQSLYKQHDSVFGAAIKKWFSGLLDARLQDAIQQERQYRELISPREKLPCLQAVGSSRKAKARRELLQRLGASNEPILLLGEKGTMKRRVAQQLHEGGRAGDGPLIVFDAAEPPGFLNELLEKKEVLFRGRDALQIAALFGIEDDLPAQRQAGWHGFLQLARHGTLVIHHAGLLGAKVQRLLAAYLQNGQFFPVGSSVASRTQTRLIFTEETDLDLHRELLGQLSRSTVRLNSLRERKKDLKEMVALLVEFFAKKEGKALTIDQQAVNKILAYNWPGNYRELEEVLHRAATLSHGPVIGAGDIFVGRVSITGKAAFNLLQLDTVRHLFSSPFYPVAAQGVIAALFVIVVLLGLFGNPAADSNVSLLLIWANWEPLLIISCLLLARVWCSLCPIGFVTQFFQKLPLKRSTLSPRALNKALFVSAAGLAVVFWSQAALDMWQRPASTAGLLLAMLVSAVLFTLLYEGRVWCRTLCPLGQMVGTFGRISVVEVRSNFNYCSHECRSYDCFNGRDGIPGCQMVKGPFALESNHNCTLCGNCIKTCPNQSVRLNLRPPGWELWHMQKADLAALLFVPLLWGTQLFRMLLGSPFEHWLRGQFASLSVVYAVLMAAALLFSYHVAVAGISFMSWQESGRRSSSLFVFAMLPLTYATEVAIRLAPLFNRAADFFKVLGRQVGKSLPEVVFRLDMQSIEILQILLIGTGLAFSLFVLNRYEKEEKSDRLVRFFRQLPLFIMAAVSVYLL